MMFIKMFIKYYFMKKRKTRKLLQVGNNNYLV